MRLVVHVSRYLLKYFGNYYWYVTVLNLVFIQDLSECEQNRLKLVEESLTLSSPVVTRCFIWFNNLQLCICPPRVHGFRMILTRNSD